MMPETPLVNDEKDLLLQLRDGEATAFKAIYDRHSVFIFRRLIHLVKIEHIARELTQEVFVRLWEKRQLIDPAYPVLPYLSKIAGNLVVDLFRKAARDRALKAELCNSQAGAMAEHPDQRLLNGEERTVLWKAIRRLPVQQQSVFQLCKLEGLSHEEVSDKLGISVSTVNNHIVKANKTVRRFLVKYLSVGLPFFLSSSLFQLFFSRH